MAYIGNNALPFNPMQSQGKPRDAQRFNGNGSTTSFTLNWRVDSSTDIEVFVENVQQEPLVAYSASAYTLTFTEAPPNGSQNIYVVYRNFNNDVVYSQIPDGSITYNKLANNIRLFNADNFVGDNSTVAFTMTESPASANTIFVSVDGIVQLPPKHYSVSGNTITFTSAPPASSNVHVKHLGFRTTSEVTAVAPNSTITSPNILGNTNFDNGTMFIDSVGDRVSIGGNTQPEFALTVNGVGKSIGVMSSSDPLYTYRYTASASGPAFFIGKSRGSAMGQHSAVANNDVLWALIAQGSDGTQFQRSAEIWALVDNTNISSTSMPGRLEFRTAANNATGGSTRLVLDSSGVAYFPNGQIKFPAAQNASSDPNTLDDYEEGTWTPSLNATGVTYSQQIGTYTKVGRTVTVQFYIAFTTWSSASGNIAITGLPFVGMSTSNYYQEFCVPYFTNVTLPASCTVLGTELAPNSNGISFYGVGSTVSNYVPIVYGTHITSSGTGKLLLSTFTYQASA